MRTARLVGATLIVKLVLGLFLLSGASAVLAQDECVVTVEPRKAVAGSDFTLSGSGYTPDTLVLEHADGDPVTIDLELGNADPFEIPIGSQTGDEGLWKATVSVSGTDCEASARFRVTLHDTDTVDELAAASAGIDPLVYVAVVIGGFALGMFVGRRRRLAV